MHLGTHAAYLWASYAIVALALVGLVTWLILDGRRQRHRIDELEARGVRRRSGRGGDAS
jgi:heme exporter protein D